MPIEAVSDNKNRAVQEIKTILKDHNGKWSESGSVQWAFEKSNEGYQPKFPRDVPEREAEASRGAHRRRSMKMTTCKIFTPTPRHFPRWGKNDHSDCLVLTPQRAAWATVSWKRKGRRSLVRGGRHFKNKRNG